MHMKRIITLITGIIAVLSSWAQSFEFQYQGESLADGDTVTISAEEDLFGDLSCETNNSMNPTNGLMLKLLNGTTATGSAILEITHNTLDAEMLQWCMGGACTSFNNQTSLTKQFTVTDRTQVQFDAIAIHSEGYLTATLKATIGLESHNVNILFVNGINTPSFAYIDGIYYNFSGDKAEVTYQEYENSNYSGSVVIPQSVTYNGKTYSVTSIGGKAFYSCSGLTSVTIPNSMTSIGNYAFEGCSSLTSVTIPNSVTNIGKSAFMNCSGLISVTIPNSVTNIGDYAFSGCSGLISINIPNSVTNISNFAFGGCSGLISVTIPNSVTSIGGYAFSWCSSLTSIILPKSVTSIGNWAFYGCSGLTDVYCYGTEPPIAYFNGWDDEMLYCFDISYIKKYTTLHVPASSLEAYKTTAPWSKFGTIVAIDDSPNIIFADANVKAICIANWDTNHDEELSEAEAASVTDLGGIFKGNKQICTFDELQYFTGLTSIGGSAFSGCSGLTSVTIGNSVTSIGESVFSGCSGLTSVTIPNSVTSIGNSAFSNCSGLTSVTIPNNVTSIGDWAFGGCKGLTSVTIPNSVTSIGDGAFSGCDGLTSINIPDGVTNIGNYVFSGCSGLTSVTIPNSVTSIGESAFQNCSDLTSVTIPNSVTSIGSYAFENCSGLTSATIPNSVTSIGYQAFSGCSNLTSVTIPSSVTSIDISAFEACSGLTFIKVEAGNTKYDSRNNCNAIIESATNTLVIGCRVTVIPNSVTSIGNSAFCNCSGLTSIIIPNSVTSIGNYAFQNCSGLTSVTIPNSVTSIGSYAFYNCSSLTSATIGNSVTSIGDGPFWGCSSLTSVMMSEGVHMVQANFFEECYNLNTITLPSTIETIGFNAFPSSKIKDVYCYATSVASTNGNAFNNSVLPNATLHVPASAIDYYRTTAPWSRFGTIVKLDDVEPVEKCATPTISYKNGQLIFDSETEGVEFKSSIRDTDINDYTASVINLTATYTITVYATKSGYEDSEVATATLCWIDVEPQTEGIIDEDAVTEVKALPVLIQTQGGTISIQGVAEGTSIAIYDTNGKQYGSTISENGRTTVSTSLQPGTTAIVKIGEKAVKVVIK